MKDFGPIGDGPKAKSVLDGTYIPPPSANLSVCKLPNEEVATKLPRTVQHFQDSWKIVKENTSSRSIHFGHFKAAVQHPTLLLTHYALAEIPFCTGYVPTRWKQATDVI